MMGLPVLLLVLFIWTSVDLITAKSLGSSESCLHYRVVTVAVSDGCCTCTHLAILLRDFEQKRVVPVKTLEIPNSLKKIKLRFTSPRLR